MAARWAAASSPPAWPAVATSSSVCTQASWLSWQPGKYTISSGEPSLSPSSTFTASTPHAAVQRSRLRGGISPTVSMSRRVNVSNAASNGSSAWSTVGALAAEAAATASAGDDNCFRTGVHRLTSSSSAAAWSAKARAARASAACSITSWRNLAISASASSGLGPRAHSGATAMFKSRNTRATRGREGRLAAAAAAARAASAAAAARETSADNCARNASASANFASSSSSRLATPATLSSCPSTARRATICSRRAASLRSKT
mmetsp:Transcript_55862/g.170036  ORF Transcript_55862/g.170036 Transcript_55862/m.170036 type:complete len:262 (+) Transcript_55862:339-1124(+)